MSSVDWVGGGAGLALIAVLIWVIRWINTKLSGCEERCRQLEERAMGHADVREDAS